MRKLDFLPSANFELLRKIKGHSITNCNFINFLISLAVIVVARNERHKAIYSIFSSYDVTARFTSVSFAKFLPAKCFFRGSEIRESLGEIGTVW
jgi:uncharacterized membrane-anchored protein YitT (DUF2179 family)